MIILTDVAAKLSEILNSESCPSSFHFVVKSQGYHLDSIADHKTGENKIPVFLTMVGGEYNPVPNLHEANFTYGVTIWFPIRYKEEFYNLNEYLEETFVGKKIQIGNKVTLCNISVAEYGEITGLHLDKFEEFLEDTYEGNVHIFKKEHDISEEYMLMEFRLFATTLGDEFLFGNDVKYELTLTLPILNAKKILVNYKSGAWDLNLVATRKQSSDIVIGTKTYYAWSVSVFATITIYTEVLLADDFNSNIKFYSYENNEMNEIDYFAFLQIEETEESGTTQTLTEQLVWDQSGTGASISPVSQQLVGIDKYVRNIQNITNFNKSITVYVKDNEFWTTFLYCYNKQELDLINNISLVKRYYFNNQTQTYIYNQILLSYNENVNLGDPVSFTLAFGDGE